MLDAAFEHITPNGIRLLAALAGPSDGEPDPVVKRDCLRTYPAQMLKSWYAFLFQIPSLPERAVRANNWRFLISATPADLTAEERDRYRKAWSQPGAVTGMINWYRTFLANSKINGIKAH